MEISTTVIVFVLFFLIFIFIIQFVISSQTTNYGNEIADLQTGVDAAEIQIQQNTTSISDISSKTQRISATTSKTTFSGNVNVDGDVFVNNRNVLTEINDTIEKLETDVVPVSNVTCNSSNFTGALTTNSITIRSGMLISPPGFIISNSGYSRNPNDDAYGIFTIFEVPFTLGRVPVAYIPLDLYTEQPYPIEDLDDGYIINPGFSFSIFVKVKFEGVEFSYSNETGSSPIFVLADLENARQMSSIIVYYRGDVFNPMGFTIPEEYKKAPPYR